MKYLALFAIVSIILSLIGCGGGNATNSPTITKVVITQFPDNNDAGGGSLTSIGGYVIIAVNFARSTPIDAKSVLIDVVDVSGTSAVDGPQPMELNSDPYIFSYQLTLAANTTHEAQVYTFTVTASDTLGHKINPPAKIGVVTVPGS